MKLIPFLLMGLLFPASSLLAQTKKIAFESHSGARENFTAAMNTDLFEAGESDFGLPSPREIKVYRLDSLIFVSESVAIVISSEYSRPFSEPKDSARFSKRNRDTVYGNALYGQQHSLDSIRLVLKTDGYYINANRLSKVAFIGYDNQKPKKNSKPEMQKHEWVPVPAIYRKPGNNSPFDETLFLMIGAILLFSLLGGWLSWKFYQPRLQ